MAVTRRSLWDVLGIENTSDPVAIRRAYARRLKVTNPEDDPEGFKELREAYEVALLHAHHARWAEAQGETGPEESVTDPVADATEHEPETYGPDSREDEQKPPVRRITAEEIARGVMDVQTGAVPSLTGSPLGVHERAASADTPSELDRLANSHREACGALARLVETPGAERRAIEAALDDLLKSPAMDSIDLHHRTEYWLASLILNGDDRGAALIDPAIRYFGWDSPRLGVTHQAGYAVLVRREELANLQQYARPGSPHARAFRSLRCKPRGLDLVLTRITPNLPDRVDHLLRKIRREKPVLERYLDAEAVAWWDHHLSATRVGPLTFWCAAVLAFVLNGFVPHGALAEFLPEALQLPVFLLLWAISFVGLGAGLVGLVLLRLYGLSWPRAWWRRRWAGRAPVWVRLGWAPAALALPTAALLSPPSWASAAWIGGIGLAIAIWARIVGDMDTRQLGLRWKGIDDESAKVFAALFRSGMHLGWRLRSIFAFAPLLMGWMAVSWELPEDIGLQAALGAFLAALTFVVGAGSLANTWRGAPARFRQGALVALLFLLAATALLVALAAVTPTLRTTAIVAVSVVVILHKPIGFDLEGRAFRVRDMFMRYGWVAMIFLTGALVPAELGGKSGLWAELWLLAGVSLALAGAFARSTLDQRQPAAATSESS